LREVERKEKEVGNLLEKYVSSSAQVLGDVQMDILSSSTWRCSNGYPQLKYLEMFKWIGKL